MPPPCNYNVLLQGGGGAAAAAGARPKSPAPPGRRCGRPKCGPPLHPAHTSLASCPRRRRPAGVGGSAASGGHTRRRRPAASSGRAAAAAAPAGARWASQVGQRGPDRTSMWHRWASRASRRSPALIAATGLGSESSRPAMMSSVEGTSAHCSGMGRRGAYAVGEEGRPPAHQPPRMHRVGAAPSVVPPLRRGSTAGAAAGAARLCFEPLPGGGVRKRHLRRLVADERAHCTRQWGEAGTGRRGEAGTPARRPAQCPRRRCAGRGPSSPGESSALSSPPRSLMDGKEVQPSMPPAK